ncbi:DUF2779 domain-containing protein (plasmid) [Sphingobium yanoikuyae]|uniref:DUF2779 domain-containing protein n=1 Tax=Sphingobium yanoikuyae TaxID=13690 RepID=A0A6M4GIR9_SPHYA|nr:DUF2779 domain-containing protein [Sphingobium yanoikuyae]QJR05687.1 DUF2779 domain-containing protein [Sphingobium yanoikuyae]
MTGLSKSRIAAFEQCPRRLWLKVHSPEAGEIGAVQERIQQAGHDVGDLACAQYPGGIMVEAVPNLAAAVRQTRELIEADHGGPIFEATFAHEGVVVRADILLPDGTGGWQVIEVKSSSQVKDHYCGDLATQVWVMEQAGLKITSAAIQHLDGDFVLTRPGDYNGLFKRAELSDYIRDIVASRDELAIRARDMLTSDEPVCATGRHCKKPVSCEFIAWCASTEPAAPEWPVTILPRRGGEKWQKQGIDDLLHLDEAVLSRKHADIVSATRTGVPFHDAVGASRAMEAWTWPRAWLDFETIAFAVPRWLGTSPYQQIPFQFSLHVEAEDGTITHHEFLDLTGTDPREACARALLDMIPAEATVIAYHASFEKGVVRDLALAFPDLAHGLNGIAARTVDLLPITREHWYHRDQRGSWSIKQVLPTISALDYSVLEVKDGGEAQAAYLEAISLQTTDGRRSILDEVLRTYCEQDTWAMILVARALTSRGKCIPAAPQQ